jgi:uncharacterized protein (DUF2267 family)
VKLRQLFEEPRTAVIAFGRMNPPTIGHQKLVDKIKSFDGDHYVFLSQSQKPKTDPLMFADKLRYAKFFFPEVTIGHPEVKTIIQALQKINQLGYTDLVYVAGSDRVASFEDLINKYNGKEYNFNTIDVVSAGERDPDADGAEGMSASKMRAAAAAGDIESFKQGVPRPEIADEMFAAVRTGMGIKDEVPAESVDEGFGNWFKNTFSGDPIFRAWYMNYKQDPKAAAKKFPSKHREFLARVQKECIGEDVSPENEKKFHNALDKLVHKYFGDSPDEEKMKKKMRKVKESNIVLDKSRLRSHIISLIADKIAETDDIEQLAEWLKMIVGKELSPRGSRYQITSEDVAIALEACKNKRKKMREAEQSKAEKVKPLPIPQFPEMPQQAGDLGDGAIAKQTKQGMTLSNAEGTFLWGTSGKPAKWRSPTMNGITQTHDLKTGNFVQKYDNSALAVDQEYDRTGNPVGRASKAYRVGDTSMSIDKKGNKTVKQRDGSEETVTTTSSMKDRWGNPVTTSDGEVVGTTPDKRRYRYTDKRTKTEIK